MIDSIAARACQRPQATTFCVETHSANSSNWSAKVCGVQAWPTSTRRLQGVCGADVKLQQRTEVGIWDANYGREDWNGKREKSRDQAVGMANCFANSGCSWWIDRDGGERLAAGLQSHVADQTDYVSHL